MDFGTDDVRIKGLRPLIPPVILLEELLAEQAAKEAAYKKVFEHWDKTRKEMFSWFGTTERAYADFAFQPPA